MKKNAFFVCFYALAFIVMLINGIYLAINNIYVDMSDVPSGEYVSSSLSPDKSRELKIYIVETKIGNAVRVSCTRNGETKNVFWQTNVDNANIGWNNNNVVFINGIRLDFDKGETFDSQSMKSIFNGGLMGWEK
jgi:hypothetical protein